VRHSTKEKQSGPAAGWSVERNFFEGVREARSVTSQDDFIGSWQGTIPGTVKPLETVESSVSKDRSRQCVGHVPVCLFGAGRQVGIEV
jgi:hypothetical protein